MPRPRDDDHRLERLNACGWSLVEFGTWREMIEKPIEKPIESPGSWMALRLIRISNEPEKTAIVGLAR